MHPEVFWRNVQWHEGDEIKVFLRAHQVLDTPYFTTSPVAELRRGAPPFSRPARRRPAPVSGVRRSPRRQAYLAQRLLFSNGEISYASWATRRPAVSATKACRAHLAPFLAQRIELESAYFGTRSLLEVYLGKNAARRVLAGAFRRGGGELIEAAIWFYDLATSPARAIARRPARSSSCSTLTSTWWRRRSPRTAADEVHRRAHARDLPVDHESDAARA